MNFPIWSNALVRLRSVRLLRDRRAVTALEYGIIATVLALSLLAIFEQFGTQVGGMFTAIGTAL